MGKVLGSEKLLLSITHEITRAIHPLYANRAVRANKLGDAFYQYFTQGTGISRPTAARWQTNLANQLLARTDLIDIHPGNVDSYGWVSVVAYSKHHVMTTLLINEAELEMGQLCTLITSIDDYAANAYKP
jgi:hypothetical protein